MWTRGRGTAASVGCGCSFVVHACVIAWVASADPCRPGEGGDGALTAQAITLIEESELPGSDELDDPEALDARMVGPRWAGEVSQVMAAAFEPRRVAGSVRARVLVSTSAPEVPEETAAPDARLDTVDPWDLVAAGASGALAGVPDDDDMGATREPVANQDADQEGAADEIRPVRLYDPFPSLPTGDVDVTVEVCVSGQGAVSDARIDGGAPEPSRSALRRAILSWRYRPLEIKGVQTAFCHRMRITYGTH
jgi:hypothetical protein